MFDSPLSFLLFSDCRDIFLKPFFGNLLYCTIFCHLFYNSQNGEDSQANENEAECIVAKNRHGETSVVRLGWDGAHTRFSNLDVSHEY